VVEEAAAVLRVFGGDDESGTAQGDEVLQRGVETLADVSRQNGGGAALAIGEDLKQATAGGIAQRGIDGIRRNDLRRRRGDRGRRDGRAHASFLPDSPSADKRAVSAITATKAPNEHEDSGTGLSETPHDRGQNHMCLYKSKLRPIAPRR